MNTHTPMGDPISKSRIIRMLFVEDDPTEVLLITDVLGNVPGVDFLITRAGRLSEALNHLAKTEFDVALLDLGLPDSTGIDTFTKFTDAARDLPVLVLTAHKDENVGLKAVQLGAQEFLVKNQIQHSLLGRFIKFAIERHRLQKTLQDLREQEQREHEMESMERLSHLQPTSVTAGIYSGNPLRDTASAQFNQLVNRYGAVLDMALEQRIHKDESNACSKELRDIAIDLGFLRASPRDVIDIHISALKPKTQNIPWKKAQAYREESRLIVLELMGNLTGYYRSGYRSLECTESENE